jgi:integrase
VSHQLHERGQTDTGTHHVRCEGVSEPVAVAAYNALAAGKENAAPLCTNGNGQPLYEMRYWFLRALEASGVEDFTFHDVRHTGASRWVMSGVPLAAVAKYLGHSGAAMVMRYAHLQPEVNAKAISAAMSFYALPPDPVIKKQRPKAVQKVTPAEVILAKGA